MPETVSVPQTDGDVLLGDILERAMDKLPDGMRQVLILHDVEGYTHEEIGEFLGVTAGTSKSQLFKARAKMRDMLRPIQGNGAEGEQGAAAWGI
jgi:RNA polymerase sigma-70 factor (ECF subfamily)